MATAVIPTNGTREQIRREARRLIASNRDLVQEMVGRTAPPTLFQVQSAAISVDRTQSDHRWWSYFRRGKQPGYELASAFAQPTLNIMAAWTLGDKFTAESGNEADDQRLSEFIDDQFDTLLTWYTDGLGLGDAYLVINPDGSLSMASPETVEVVTDDFNYRKVIAIRITTRMEKVTIIDEYRPEMRTVTVVEGMQKTTFPFANPLGEIPVAHWCPGKEANELHGHPAYEALLMVFTRYHDVLKKSLDGVEIMGRPILSAEGLEDPAAAKELNKTDDEMIEDSAGVKSTRPVVDIGDVEMWWLGKGGTLRFVAPPQFAEDSRKMLKALFLLTLEHLNIPEFVWGGAIASSKASADAQMPAFTRIVQLWQTMFEKPLLNVLRLWLRTVSAFEFLPEAGRIKIEWPDLVGEDENIVLRKIDQADKMTAITRETALRIMNLVDDPAAEVAAAEKEAEERQDAFERTVDELNGAETGGEDEAVEDEEQEDG